MNPTNFDLTDASRVYSIANTPAFLVRKLQSDSVVRKISEQCSAEEILRELRTSLGSDPLREPESAEAAVRPYAYLVALWFKPELEHLKEASSISAPVYRWYGVIAELLIETFSPVQNQSVTLPGVLNAPMVSLEASAPTTTPVIILVGN